MREGKMTGQERQGEVDEMRLVNILKISVAKDD